MLTLYSRLICVYFVESDALLLLGLRPGFDILQNTNFVYSKKYSVP